MGDDESTGVHRRKPAVESAGGDHAAHVSGEESRRRATEAQRARAKPGVLASILSTPWRCYDALDQVVSAPVVLSFIALLATVYYIKRPRDPRQMPGNGPQEGPWRWAYGTGKDVVGKVNCTTYWHAEYGTVVEFGHGSGGGITFRSGTGKSVRWVWEDGAVEDVESIACPDVETVLQKGGGKFGTPKYRMFNRYNRQFWTPQNEGGNITFRNAMNPIRVVLHPRGFEFQIREMNNVSVIDGRPVGQHTIDKSDNPFQQEAKIDTPFEAGGQSEKPVEA
mmetsp:Transcript_28600/g.66706  ORF Transcript_28600/g.66706 Transcript_28600/m.66706 type:complete len:279 (-) Transcript_28600:62-898(-)